MTDIVERLHRHADLFEGDEGDLMRTAAAEIERLRAALQSIRDEVIHCGGNVIDGPDIDKIHDLAAEAIRARSTEDR